MDISSNEVIHSGILRKKGGRLNVWSDRYFSLKSNALYYYLRSSDNEPRGSFPITTTSQVSEIKQDDSKRKKQYIFTLTTYANEESQRDDATNAIDVTAVGTKGSPDASQSNTTQREFLKKKYSLSSGVGYLTGIGVHAANGAAHFLDADDGKSLLLGSVSFHEAEQWVNAIENVITDLKEAVAEIPTANLLNYSHTQSNVGGHSIATTAISTAGVYDKSKQIRRNTSYQTHVVRPEVRITEVEEWIMTSKWKVFDVYEGLRLLHIYQPGEIGISSSSSLSSSTQGGVVDTSCMRVDISVNASAAETFTMIHNFTDTLQTGIIKSLRVVETIDNFTDIIHLKLEPIYLHPTWTAPRDFCLIRYWKDNQDGSYVICFNSTSHPDVPLIPGYIRGDLHCAYVTAPPKRKAGGMEEDDISECLLTFVAQLDPKGWIWESFGYTKLFLKNVMLHVLDVKDALDSSRFLQVHFDRPVSASSLRGGPKASCPSPSISGRTHATTLFPADNNNASLNVVYGGDEEEEEEEVGTIATIPPPILSPTMWKDSDASTFKVRGASYMTDKVKANSAPCMFKFIGIDLYETDGAYQNIASHPKNRVHQALQRGDDSWVFVVNFMVPGNPYYSSFVSYFIGNKSDIEADTPFGSIARPFFNGNDNEFRNNRFKLIPKVVDGNMMIKMAVKDTPTLIGNKLKQYYHKGDNYFEVDVDIGSSSVARNACGLAIGYSKSIVVDLGFVLQGNEEHELPEVLMGCYSCYRVDMSTGTRLI